ncbi:MFS transporter [Altererythrobacter salegens]|uniref:MFS transporter n=1 Tax=Croceibacterium salegens TaxID=1737568 RepID=A0A6I4SXY0_9SPHN|nr:MFS transporter [Croceibacterium salegens]MXO59716.1 MFS transporter [Croceibacterium salegens]
MASEAATPGASEYPTPRQAWYTVGVLAVITTFALLDQNILGLLIQQIKTDFDLTDSEAGLLLGPTQAIFYALVAVPFSRYIDRWTRKWIVMGGLVVWSLATAASGLAASFSQLFVARVVVGAGESVNGPTAYSMVADSFPRERLPRAVATLQLGTVAGSGLSLLLGGAMIWLVAPVGSPDLPLVGVLRPWQAVLLGVGLPGLLVSLLLLSVKEPPRRNLTLRTEKAGLRTTLRYLWLRFAVFGPMFIGLTIGSLDVGGRAWGAAFFERTYGWSPATYGIASGIISIPLMLTGLFLGAKWAEWFQNRGDPAGAYRVILYTRLAAIPFSIMMPLTPTPELSLAFNGVIYLTLGMSGPMLNAVMLAISPNQIRGQIMTLYLFIYTVVGVGLAPYVTGLTTDVIFTSPDDLRWSIVLLHVVFLPASLVVTWLGLKPFRAEVERLNAEEAAEAN